MKLKLKQKKKQEYDKLTEEIKILDKNLSLNFRELGKKLQIIKEEKLYEVNKIIWEEYCDRNVEYSRRHCDCLIDIIKFIPLELELHFRKSLLLVQQIRKIKEEKERKLKTIEWGNKIKKLTLKESIEFFQQLKEDEEELTPLPDWAYQYNIWFASKERPSGYGSRYYPGNTPPILVDNLLAYIFRRQILTKNFKNIICLDTMSGSGSFPDVCKEWSIKCDASDLKDGIDARKANKYFKKKYDLIFNHFPYWTMVKYSNNEADLSITKNVEKFYEMVIEIFECNKRLLKEDGYYAVLIGDYRREKEVIDLPGKLIEIGKQTGYKLHFKVYWCGEQKTHVSGGIAKYRADLAERPIPCIDVLLVFKLVKKDEKYTKF